MGGEVPDMPRLLDAWEFGGDEGLPPMACYVVSQQIVEFDRKQRRPTLSTLQENLPNRALAVLMYPPKHKGGKPPKWPNPEHILKKEKRVYFLGRSGFEIGRKNGVVWIYDGSVPFWIDEKSVSNTRPPIKTLYRSRTRH